MAGCQAEGQEQAQPQEQPEEDAQQPGRPADGEESETDESSAREQESITSETEGELQDLRLARQETKRARHPLSKTGESVSDSMVAINRFAKRLLNGVILLPMDFTLSLSRGFHNAPKLYNDRMVKATRRVVGLRSGFRVAGEVWPHFYDFKSLSLTIP